MSAEYRVRWRREGGQWTTRIFQRQHSARRKVLAILAVDAIREEFAGLRTMQALSDPPVVQRREVGPWEEFEQDSPVLTEQKIETFREWATYRYPEQPEMSYGDSGGYDDEIEF